MGWQVLVWLKPEDQYEEVVFEGELSPPAKVLTQSDLSNANPRL
ncbi:hypothetical protein M23134_01709 [Microscilla marina ATCC 23134]|uniref:Uncharacterized protein n=1 Tax=Microscilla marina ATCC 23134 TaxID=313606 RepID=A1ZSX5_MICM2|nr:hypothetical protein M23134_01709 [Microscilla marina ATCC 23134]